MPSDSFLILATQEGICRIPIRPDGHLGSCEQPLRGVALEAVCQDASGILYAGSDEGKIYRSHDGGVAWLEVSKGFPNSRGLWSLAAHPLRPKELYAGLEPVSLWVSSDGGDHWQELHSLRAHPEAKNWHFFDPMQPHVRTVGFDSQGERLFIGIEEGGVLISRDGGRSFEDRSHGVDEDLHLIQVAPDNPDRIFAMTGGGLFRSRDGGRQWEKLTQGLDRWYFVPLAFVSAKPNILCVGAGNTPPPAWRTQGADAAIYWSEDGGDRWKTATGPFPLRGMLSSIITDVQNPDRLFAGTTDGVLLSSSDKGQRWKVETEKLPRIEEMIVSLRLNPH